MGKSISDVDLRERRYRIAPQMRDYDQLEERRRLPYVMFFHPSRHETPSFTTDDQGFRRSVGPAGPLSFDQFCGSDRPRGVLIGGSTAFGVGATSDAQTIPSHLNRAGDRLWFNFAGRAFNSTQEWLLFLLHLPASIQKVVVLSGLNNLALSYWAGSASPVYNAFYEERVQSRGLGAAARHLLDKIRRTPSEEHGRDGRAVTEESYHVVMTCFRRDMRIWHLLREALGFQVHFVLQPIASWMPKSLAPQEREMFSLLDTLQGAHWDILSSYLTHWADRYRSDIREICESFKIPFLDLNGCRSFLQPEWLFVDRAHLTDAGYGLCSEEIRKEFSL